VPPPEHVGFGGQGLQALLQLFNVPGEGRFHLDLPFTYLRV
jgi:hypothetical protein